MNTTYHQTNRFAFLIHFRFDIRDDMALYWKPLKKVPEKWYRSIFDRDTPSSFKWGEVRSSDNEAMLGINEMIMLNSEMFLRRGHRTMSKVINKTIDRLVDKGYSSIGLGALTAPLTKGGLMLKDRQDVSITNGNAYTSAIMFQAVEKLIRINGALGKTVAIVGASGSVGSCLSKLILKNNLADRLIMTGRSIPRLQKLEQSIGEDDLRGNVEFHHNLDRIHEADLVCLLTTSPDAILRPDQLKKDAVILDGTQPRNTRRSLVEARPDITVVDGGIVYAPGISLRKGSLDLPEHHYYACFSETALLSMDGHKGHFCLGYPTLDQAEHMLQLAQRHGFGLAPFISFGETLTNSIYAQ